MPGDQDHNEYWEEERASKELSMSSEAQRIAIAEECGWVVFGLDAPLCQMPCGSKVPIRLLPDYLKDLNAMHEAEKMLKNHQLWFMTATLAKIVPAEIPIAHASAAQRAEAFLRTIRKCKD